MGVRVCDSMIRNLETLPALDNVLCAVCVPGYRRLLSSTLILIEIRIHCLLLRNSVAEVCHGDSQRISR